MVTLQNVADRAGVSLSTASYVLSGKRPVGEDASARVRAAISELGYTANFAARSLASARTRVIALIYPALETGLGSTVQELVQAASDTAREHGYALVLWPFTAEQPSEITALARQGLADGILVMEVSLEDQRVAALDAADIPFTMIGRTAELGGLSWVDVDFDATIETAISLLVGQGHRHIALINHSDAAAATGYAPIFRAECAFRRGMKARGLTPIDVRAADNPHGGRQTTAQLLDKHPELTAIITMNELATFGVLEELNHRALTIPDDISIVSVVSSAAVSGLMHPPLTTLAVPGGILGRQAVLNLLSQLGETVPEVENLLLNCDQLTGASLGPVRV